MDQVWIEELELFHQSERGLQGGSGLRSRLELEAGRVDDEQQHFRPLHVFQEMVA